MAANDASNVATIADFKAGDRLKLVIDCMPRPLFRILERDGYDDEVEPGEESLYLITMRARSDRVG